MLTPKRLWSSTWASYTHDFIVCINREYRSSMGMLNVLTGLGVKGTRMYECKCVVRGAGVSSPLPQVQSPSYNYSGDAPSSVDRRQGVRGTPQSVNRRRGRENDGVAAAAPRRSQVPSVGNSGYTSPFDEAGTPGTPGVAATPSFNRGTYPYSCNLSAFVLIEKSRLLQ